MIRVCHFLEHFKILNHTMFYKKNPIFALSLSALLLTSCGITPPVNFPQNSWRALNELPSDATEIPLFQQRLYQPLRIDVSLKGMLQRWTKQANMTLSYKHSSDFTLYSGVANIQQPNLEEAIQELNTAYQHKSIKIYLANRMVVVTGEGMSDSRPMSDPSRTLDPKDASFPSLPDLPSSRKSVQPALPIKLAPLEQTSTALKSNEGSIASEKETLDATPTAIAALEITSTTTASEAISNTPKTMP